MTGGPDASRLPAEARARALIDNQLGAAGWSVQDKTAMNLFAARGIAVREVTLKPGHGRADYLLYVDPAANGSRRRAGSPSPTTSSSLATRSTWTLPGCVESLEDVDNLPSPEVIAREIVEDLTGALAEFEAGAAALESANSD